MYRQLLTGGPVEMVTTCEGASALIRAGSEIYCTQFGGALLHAPVTGGAPVFIPYANGYPIHTLTLDGSDLYFVNMYNNPQIYRVPLPNGPMVMLDQHPSIKRFWGLALSADSIYVTGYQLRRFNRTTLVDEAIYTAHSSSSDPVLWNDDLYFAAENRQSGYRLIMHCVD